MMSGNMAGKVLVTQKGAVLFPIIYLVLLLQTHIKFNIFFILFYFILLAMLLLFYTYILIYVK